MRRMSKLSLTDLARLVIDPLLTWPICRDGAISMLQRAAFLWLMAVAFPCCGCASLSPLTALEHRLAFVPVRYPLGDWEPEEIRPEDAWFTAADGTKLHG